MSHKIIDEVKTGSIQFFEKYDKLNPVKVSIRDSDASNIVW